MKLSVAITLVAFFGVFGVANSQCMNENNIITNKIIRAVIEANRHKLANLKIAQIDLKEYGKLSNIVIVDAEKFVLESFDDESFINLNVANASIRLNPVSATADIDLKNLRIPEIGLVVNGKGHLRGGARNMFISARLHISRNGFGFYLDDISSIYFRVGEVQGELSGVDNAEAANTIINNKLKDYLNGNVVALVQQHKQDILKKINDAIHGIC